MTSEADFELDFDAIAEIDEHSTGLADAAEEHLDAPVPSCPGWTMADLVWHLFRVQHFWGQIVAGRLTDPEQVPELPRPGNDRVVAGFRAHAARFVTVLQAADPHTPVWTWARQQDAAFVVRHQVQEAAVHRWDAEQAAGRDFEIDPPTAADALEEFLTFSTGPRAATEPDLGGPIALVATDLPVSWTITDGADSQLAWVRGDPFASATRIRATTSELLLWAYRRVPPHTLDVHGDATRLARFDAFTRTS